MKTAVEWLIEQLKDMEYDLRLIPNTIEQAKAMEKRDIISGYSFGHNDGCRYINNVKQEFAHGEQYYNETFKSE